VIRPIRDEIGAAGGVEKLPWLFTGTLIGMTLANPPYSAWYRGSRRCASYPSVTGFSPATSFCFWCFSKPPRADRTCGRAGSSISGQPSSICSSCRCSGVHGGHFHQRAEPAAIWFHRGGRHHRRHCRIHLTSTLVEHAGRSVLLLLSAVLLEVAVFSVRGLARNNVGMRERKAAGKREAPVGGSVLSGIYHAIRSPYLMNISIYMLLFTILSTFLYFQQADIAKHSFTDRATRTAFFADVDLAVNILTLAIQLFLTGRILRKLGVALTLTLLPAVSAVGFLLLGMARLYGRSSPFKCCGGRATSR